MYRAPPHLPRLIEKPLAKQRTGRNVVYNESRKIHHASLLPQPAAVVLILSDCNKKSKAAKRSELGT